MQQRQGRVRQTLQLRTSAINDDDKLEREADVMGARALVAGRDVIARQGVDTSQLPPAGRPCAAPVRAAV